jgi:uncharacterized protein (UPF0332 family)
MTTWKEFKHYNRLKPHKTSKKEINDLFEVIERDLQDAAVEGISNDRRFATAYNAVLQLCKIVICIKGYRVSGHGHHHTSLEAAQLILGSKTNNLISYFDVCRRKRNLLDYEKAKVITQTEADEILVKAKEFRNLIKKWQKVSAESL